MRSAQQLQKAAADVGVADRAKTVCHSFQLIRNSSRLHYCATHLQAYQCLLSVHRNSCNGKVCGCLQKSDAEYQAETARLRRTSKDPMLAAEPTS